MHGLSDLVTSGKVLYLGIINTPAWIVAKANEYVCPVERVAAVHCIPGIVARGHASNRARYSPDVPR